MSGAVVKVLFIFVAAVGVLAPLLTWAERKQGALMQGRLGPSRVSAARWAAVG